MWASELRIIRRYLRDPTGKIWGDELIAETWNQSQREIQDALDILEDIKALPVPPRASASYMHDCEFSFLEPNDANYRCLHSFGGWYAFCCSAEVEVITGSTANATEDGDAYTHPHEAFFITPGLEVWYPWPNDMAQATQVYFDNEPLLRITRRALSGRDSSYLKRSGVPQSWYDLDEVENAFSLYPRPGAYTWEDPTGEGMVTFVEDDTVSSEVGTVTIRTGTLSSDTGITISVIGQTNNVLVAYRVMPADVSAHSDPLSFPPHMTKYVRYRVLERLYGANTDGRIPSLSRLWGSRFEQGMEALGKFQINRLQDRTLRLRTRVRSPAKTRRHPRLPDTYPAI